MKWDYKKTLITCTESILAFYIHNAGCLKKVLYKLDIVFVYLFIYYVFIQRTCTVFRTVIM
jgi:hypothetical protein